MLQLHIQRSHTPPWRHLYHLCSSGMDPCRGKGQEISLVHGEKYQQLCWILLLQTSTVIGDSRTMTIPCKAQNGLVIMCPGSQMARLTAPSSSITDPSTKEAIIRGQMGELNAGATMLCNFTEPLCKLDRVNVIYGGVNMMFNVKEEGGHWRPHQRTPTLSPSSSPQNSIAQQTRCAS